MHINIWDAREPNESYLYNRRFPNMHMIYTITFIFEKKTENILWFMWNYQNTNI